jgi:hypothetical protein
MWPGVPSAPEDGLTEANDLILAIRRFEASLRFELPRDEERAGAATRQPEADWEPWEGRQTSQRSPCYQIAARASIAFQNWVVGDLV